MAGTEPIAAGGSDPTLRPGAEPGAPRQDADDDDAPTRFIPPRVGEPSNAREQTVLGVAPRRARGGDLAGTLFAGRYHLRRSLGEGGMGVVYEADHAALDRRVAVKILADEFTANPDRVERFLREARTASKIRHRNVVEVTDCGIAENGKVYFVMDCLEGADLGTLLEKKGRVTWQQAVAITLEICEALDAAHAVGIIHRDIKPDNCFLTRQAGGGSCVKVLDFGVAKLVEEDAAERKLTQTGQIFGTPHYMAPEQARSSAFDHRVDLYAAGVILYELLTGEPPYDGETVIDVLMKHATEPLVPPSSRLPPNSIPPAIEAVVVRALAKAPDDRFGTAAEMAVALRQGASWSRNLNVTLEMTRDDSLRIPLDLHKTVSGRAPTLLVGEGKPTLVFFAGGVVLLAVCAVVALIVTAARDRTPTATDESPSAVARAADPDEAPPSTADRGATRNDAQDATPLALAPPAPGPNRSVSETPAPAATPTPTPAPGAATREHDAAAIEDGTSPSNSQVGLDPDHGAASPANDGNAAAAAQDPALAVPAPPGAATSPPKVLKPAPDEWEIESVVHGANVEKKCKVALALQPDAWIAAGPVTATLKIASGTGKVRATTNPAGTGKAKCIKEKLEQIKFPKGADGTTSQRRFP